MDLVLLNAVPFLLAALLAIPPVRQSIPKDVQTWLISGTMLVLFVAALGYFPYVEEQGVVTRSLAWMEPLGLSFSYYLDGLALLFTLVVTGVGTAIYLYAGYYFEEHEEQSRFNTILLVFTGAMLGLVLSGNLLTMFIMWELTSITSFMLIGFKGSKYAAARDGAFQALIITGGGGIALLAGVVGISVAAASLNGGPVSFELRQVLQTEGLTDHDWYTGLAILVFIGAFTKSAQVPFHFWLPGGMSAPTPASAFLHSATMVKAGIYLLARLYPIMGDSNLWMNTLLGFGMTTFVVGAFFALFQRDLKGLLAYTTISKLGAIVALIGLPDAHGLKAAFVGVVAHALYKAALFLCVGSIDHSTGTRHIDYLGSMARRMPGTALVTTVSALSMAGFIPLMGFLSKETLIEAMLHYAPNTVAAVVLVFVGSVFTGTAAYILIWDVFFRPEQHEVHYHAMPRLATVAPGLLMIGDGGAGLFVGPAVHSLAGNRRPQRI
ncbi:MAG: hypothetical protein HC915_04935 [Anaerolineae bacterium]|nr:hypothetical protein [Anaerolineae bacterium]